MLEIGDKIKDWTVVSEKLFLENSLGHYIGHHTLECKCGTRRDIRTGAIKKLKETGEDKYYLKSQCKRCSIQLSQEAKSEDDLIYPIYFNYINKTSKRKKVINFNLNFNEYKDLIKDDCIYCGSKPLNKFRFKHKYGDIFYIYQGIDRIDSNGHYEIGNVVPCCDFCNKGKSIHGVDIYIDYIGNLIKYNSSSTVRERIGKYLEPSIVPSSEGKQEES